MYLEDPDTELRDPLQLVQRGLSIVRMDRCDWHHLPVTGSQREQLVIVRRHACWLALLCLVRPAEPHAAESNLLCSRGSDLGLVS